MQQAAASRAESAVSRALQERSSRRIGPRRARFASAARCAAIAFCAFRFFDLRLPPLFPPAN
jgi:hypothetical protein